MRRSSARFTTIASRQCPTRHQNYFENLLKIRLAMGLSDPLTPDSSNGVVGNGGANPTLSQYWASLRLLASHFEGSDISCETSKNEQEHAPKPAKSLFITFQRDFRAGSQSKRAGGAPNGFQAPGT
jgi:hypothetical protein